jgi:DNA modification methylase
MITKERIRELKQTNLSELYSLIREKQNGKELVFLLENLGFLPKDFDISVITPLLYHPNNTVRLLAVKNLGKLAKPEHLPEIFEKAKHDDDSIVRREAVSSIGRMRSKENISFLTKLLYDQDPKVIVQAIRGLLVFKEDEEVRERLKFLIGHPNEMVQSAIRREFFTEKSAGKSSQSQPASPDFMKNTVVCGDVREILKLVPDESIHLTFTSPPYYNARDYSLYESYNAYLDFLMEVFNEVHRVTKEGRFLIVNTSPIIIPRISRAHSSKRYPIPFDLHARLVQNGWEFIDDIIWLKPETTVKNRIGGFMQHKKPLGYKPNSITEYVMVYRKQTEKLLDWNMRSYEEKTIQESKVTGKYETTNVWKIDPAFDKVHSAVFPADLCRRVIQYYSYKGDLVFDPFAGSGTVGRVANSQERYFFLTEKDESYFEYMKTKAQKSAVPMFNEIQTKFLSLIEFMEHSKQEKQS